MRRRPSLLTDRPAPGPVPDRTEFV